MHGMPAKTRKLKSWIDAFFEYTDIFPSPPLFRKWAAISAVAAVLERKVWVRTFNSNLYPNLYTVLVSPPGVGKTFLTSFIQELWTELTIPIGDHYMAPSSVTRASLMDCLHEAERKLILPQQTPSIVTFNSLMIAVNELGTLIPVYDNDFMNTLTDIYDCKRIGERKRAKEINYTLTAPQFNIITGTTPSYLNSVMPIGAWDQGFISRVILVYSGESQIKDPFHEIELGNKSNGELINDLKVIGDLYGKMTFEEDAANALGAWHKAKGPPIPDHPRLVHYVTRRTAMLLKLCMIASASRSNDLVVNLDDYQIALDWLLEVEAFMPDIFKSMVAGGDSRAIEDTWHYAYQVYIREKKPIVEARLINFLQQRVPAHSVVRVMEVMLKSKLLEKHLDAYIPMMRKQV